MVLNSRTPSNLTCKDLCTNDHPCFPIEIPSNDPLRLKHPGQCMEFVRSAAVCGTGESTEALDLTLIGIHQREQITQITSFIDGSNVYGSNEKDAFELRDFDNGNFQQKNF